MRSPSTSPSSQSEFHYKKFNIDNSESNDNIDKNDISNNSNKQSEYHGCRGHTLIDENKVVIAVVEILRVVALK